MRAATFVVLLGAFAAACSHPPSGPIHTFGDDAGSADAGAAGPVDAGLGDAGADAGASVDDAGVSPLPPDFAGCGCLVPSPHCLDGRAGDCVQCRDSFDCPASAPRCDAAHQCVQCLSQSDCAAVPGTLCHAPEAELCLPDCRVASVPCLYENVCDPHSGLCAPGCLSDADCRAEAPFCDSDAGEPGTCIACHSSSDCPPADPGCFMGHCGSCRTNEDCPAPLVCDIRGFQHCVCNGDGDCAALSPTTPSCVPTDTGNHCGCAADADCAGLPGTRCDTADFRYAPPAGACVPGCDADGGNFCHPILGITGASVCNPATGMCSTCLSDDDCVDARAWQGGGPSMPACVGASDGGAPGIGIGGGGWCGCASNADCPAGTACDRRSGVAGQCSPRCDALGGPDCAHGEAADTVPFCSAQSGACVGCSDAGQCAGLFGAARPACVGGDGGENGTCGCASDADCAGGLYCDRNLGAAGTCLPRCTPDVHRHSAACALLSNGGETFCVAATGHCSQCSIDGDCGTGASVNHNKRVCNADRGFCAHCRVPADCPHHEAGCDPDREDGCGFCRTSADCAPGATCDAQGVCRFSCDAGCSANQPFCDARSGLCYECNAVTDCPFDNLFYCDAATGQCVYP